MRDNIPTTAHRIHFTYGRAKGVFHVWPSGVNITVWQWSALGNNGEAATKEAASELARQWIINNRIKEN